MLPAGTAAAICSRPRCSAAPWSARSCWACRSCWPGSWRRWCRWSARPDRLDVVGDRRRRGRSRGVPGEAEHRGRRRVRGRGGRALPSADGRPAARGRRRPRCGGHDRRSSWGWPPTRGTDPAGVWDAVVVFRARGGRRPRRVGQPRHRQAAGRACWSPSCSAGRRSSPSRWPRRRPGGRGGADRRPAGLRSAAGALLAWEMFVVLVGGSYWLHYLMGLVPGLVVLAAASAQASPRPRPSWSRRTPTRRLHRGRPGWVLVHPIERPEEPAIGYLADARAPRGHRRRRVRHPEHPPGRRAAEPVPPAVEPARPGARPGRPRADRRARPDPRRRPGWWSRGRSVSTWGIDGAAAEPHRPVALRAGRERRRVPDLRRKDARDRGRRHRPSPDAHTAPVRAAAMAGTPRCWCCGAWLVGIPNDTGGRGAVGVARHHRVEHRRARGEHLDFWRDWWRPLLVLVVYWLLPGAGRRDRDRRSTTRCRSASTSGWAVG